MQQIASTFDVFERICYYISIFLSVATPGIRDCCLSSACAIWAVPKAVLNNEGKENMVTQAIQRWLQNLFAWWPWKRSPKSSYAHPVTARNTGAAQESTLRTTVDGSVSQTSVAVEHVQETRDTTPEQHRPIAPTPEKRTEPSPTPEERPAAPSTPSLDAEKQPTPPGEGVLIPTPEQKLAFLRYLVQRGLVNEGFEHGKEPEQYKKVQS
jgi:hypothetical protein